MHVTSQEFADDPCSSMKRGAMVRASRALLSAVTRLLIIADMVDVHLLLKSLRIVSRTENYIAVIQCIKWLSWIQYTIMQLSS
jgi:hypothetical protein